MIKTKILLSLYSAFLAVFVLQFYFGGRGLEALEDLKAYQKELDTNLRDLKLLHGKLRDRFELLKNHPETVMLAARDLGYFHAYDRVLKFQRDSNREPTPLSPGNLLERKTTAPFQDGFFRLSWAALLLLFYGLLEVITRLLPSLERLLNHESGVKLR